MQSLRVAVLCADKGIRPEAPGGAAVHLRGITSGFQSLGAQVVLWSASPEPLPGSPIRTSYRVRSLPAEDLASFLSEFGPDLVYERLGKEGPVGLEAARAVGAHWLLEVNAPLAWEEALFRGRRAHRRLLETEARHLASADQVVVVSGALARYVLRRGVPPERVRWVPNGYKPPTALSDVPPPTDCDPNSSRPFVMGYAGTFKPWQGMLEAVVSLNALAARVSPRSLALDLWGDGPQREEFMLQLSSVAPGVSARWRGWGTEAEVARARESWDAAWVPLAPWPPSHTWGNRKRRSVRSLERAFGEPIPERWFCPLKEVEARAAGLPLWRGDGLPARDHSLPSPRSWAEVASTVLQGLGFTSPRPSWEDAADPGPRGRGTAVQVSEPTRSLETPGPRAFSR